MSYIRGTHVQVLRGGLGAETLKHRVRSRRDMWQSGRENSQLGTNKQRRSKFEWNDWIVLRLFEQTDKSVWIHEAQMGTRYFRVFF